MRNLTGLLTLSAACAIASVAACAYGGPAATPPAISSHEAAGRFPFSRFPSVLDPAGLRISSALPSRASFYSCSSSGATEYVSDEFNSVIDIYNGDFAGQAPCGQIISSFLIHPNGLFVDKTTHDLYVANWGGLNILVFHKGETVPYNVYTDPNVPLPNYVALSNDGTVVASNEESSNGTEKGSISTWIGGPNGGAFVGNYPMTKDDFGMYFTIRRTGVIYFTDIDETTGVGAMWKVSCPAGVCGAQKRETGVSIEDPGGMVIDDTGDVLVNDASTTTVDTFELPIPQPSTIALPCCPIGMAYDTLHQHWFATSITYAAEYTYPSFTLIGTVPVTGGAMLGVAVDP